MAITLGDAPVRRDAATPAQRVRRPGWRDPRLWIGVVLVAGCVVAGARMLAAADDTVQVWAAASDLGAGDRLTEDDLVAQRVRFADAAALAGLLHRRRQAARRPPAPPRRRGRRAGAARGRRLAPPTPDWSRCRSRSSPSRCRRRWPPVRWSTSTSSPRPTRSGDHGRRPATARRSPRSPSSTRPPLAESFGTTGRRQLVLAVPEDDAAPFFALLGASRHRRADRRTAQLRLVVVVVLIVAAGAAWESRRLGRARPALGRRGAQALRRRRRPARHRGRRAGRRRGRRSRRAGLRRPRRSTTCARHGVRAVAVSPGGAALEAGRLRGDARSVPRPSSRHDDLAGWSTPCAAPAATTGARAAEDRSSAEPEARGRPGDRGVGPAGAPGRTTVAAGLAAVLADAGARPSWSTRTPTAAAWPRSLGVLDEVSGLLAASRLAGGGTLAERFDSVSARPGRPARGGHRAAAPGPLDRGPPGDGRGRASRSPAGAATSSSTPASASSEDAGSTTGRPGPRRAHRWRRWPSPTRSWSSAPPTRSACPGWRAVWSTCARCWGRSRSASSSTGCGRRSAGRSRTSPRWSPGSAGPSRCTSSPTTATPSTAPWSPGAP